MPAARLNAGACGHKPLQPPEEAGVGAPRVQDRVPETADNAVVPLEGRLVMRAVRPP